MMYGGMAKKLSKFVIRRTIFCASGTVALLNLQANFELFAVRDLELANWGS